MSELGRECPISTSVLVPHKEMTADNMRDIKERAVKRLQGTPDPAAKVEEKPAEVTTV